MQYKNKILLEKGRSEVKQRKYYCDGGNGKALIAFALLFCLFLAVFFHYVKVCKANQACQTIENKDSHSRNGTYAGMVTDCYGKNPKTYNVTQGIDLDSKSFLIV